MFKKLCEPCFPPSYKIFDFFVSNVHTVLSEYLRNLLDTNQLRAQEFFVLLSWQDTYKSNYFMGHPSLNLDVIKLPDLLDDVYYNRVLEGHMESTAKKISFWFQNALQKNYDEWLKNVQPYEIEGYFESSLPNDINTMLSQQLDLINYANDDRFSKETLRFIVNQLANFIDLLKGRLFFISLNQHVFISTDTLFAHVKSLFTDLKII